ILKRLTPTSDTLDSSATSVELSWKAEHAIRIAVDGKPVDATKGGVIAVKLESLHFGANRTTVIAFDSLGAPDTTISVIYRLRPTDFLVRMEQSGTTFWDSTVYLLSSADSGARYDWSANGGSSWTTLPTPRLKLNRTGAPLLRATAPGCLPTLHQTDSVIIRHTNKAPSFKSKVSDTVAVDEDAGEYRTIFATDISVGGEWDSLQQPTFKVTVIDNESLFSKLPTINVGTGMLSFTTKENATGSSRIRVVLRDNGGSGESAHWGVDSTTPDTLVIASKPVNDPPTLSPFSTISVPNVAGKIFRFKLPNGTVGGGPDEAKEGQILTYSFNAFGEGTARCSVYVLPTRDSFAVVPSVTSTKGVVNIKVTIRDSLPGIKASTFKPLEFGPLLLQIDVLDSITDTSGSKQGFLTLKGTTWMTANVGSRSFQSDSAGFAPDTLPGAKICPTGWRLPKESDWKTLLANAGLVGDAVPTKDSLASVRLRWAYGFQDSLGNYPGTNSTGLALVPNATTPSGATFARFWTAEGSIATFRRTPTFAIAPHASGDTAGVRCILE
ncbi:MAG: hypothetical protein AAB214_12935, partial [Fibrobacterota bacterium]